MLLPTREEFATGHPVGCHRRRVPDRTVFEHVVLALVHGSGCERISTPGCSDRTIRRRVKEWAEQGISKKVRALALEAYDRMIGLELGDTSIDGCITKAPSGGDKAGRSPVDRGKQGLKRSVAADSHGVPLGIVSAGANQHDSSLLGPNLEADEAALGGWQAWAEPVPGADLWAASFGASVPHDLVAAFVGSLSSSAPVLRRVLPESRHDRLLRAPAS